MYVYIFQAALLCEKCGELTRRDLEEAGEAPSDSMDEYSYDSDEYPKGPYADSGGEADYPQHCDHCNIFLENPLTDDGYNYVHEAVVEFNHSQSGNAEVISEWRGFYGV